MFNNIHGDKNIPAMKGKTVRLQPEAVTKDYIEIPEELKDGNRSIELCIDVMWIQGIPFFVTTSKHLMFKTVTPLNNRKQQTFEDAPDEVFIIHNKA